MQRRQKERSGHMDEGNKISDIIVKSIHKQAMKESETEKGSYWYFLKNKHIRFCFLALCTQILITIISDLGKFHILTLNYRKRSQPCLFIIDRILDKYSYIVSLQ